MQARERMIMNLHDFKIINGSKKKPPIDRFLRATLQSIRGAHEVPKGQGAHYAAGVV